MRYVCLKGLLAFGLVSTLLAADIVLPSGVTVAPGQQSPFPVTLASPALAGGAFVTLASSDPSRVAVSPNAVFIPEGATTTSSPAKVTGIAPGSAIISATASNVSGDAKTVQVGTPAASPTFSPATVTFPGAGTQIVQLSLPSPAPGGGLVLNLTSDSPSVAQVASNTAFFPAGSSTRIVSIVAASAGTTVIRATSPQFPDATLTVTVAGPGAIILPTGVTLNSNQSAAFPVLLTTPAPPGGVTLTLASTDTGKVVIAPTTVFVTAGSTIPANQPQVTGLNPGVATISATAPGYVGASQTVQTLSQQQSAALSFSPASLTLGNMANGALQLNLSIPAPAGGLVVNLSSNSGAVSIPASVTFAANATSVSVPVSAVAPGSAIVTATSTIPNISGATAAILVTPGPAGIILPSGLTLAPGEQVRIAVMLANPAPSGGAFINLASGDPSILLVSPATIFIPQGATTSAVQPVLTAVNFGSATLIASSPGFPPASETVRVGSSLGFSPPTLTIAGVGATQNLVLNLPVPAPVGGLTISLTSTNPAVATVPSTVNFPAGVGSIRIPVTSLAPGSTTIHASSPPALPDTTATVTVVPPAFIVLPTNVSAVTGQSVPFPISLGTPAGAGGVTISLTSSDPSRVAVSPAVFVAPGATAPSVQPQLTAFNIGTVVITASAPGYASAAQAVQAMATVSFSPSSITIVGGGRQRVLLSLSSSAPPGNTNYGRCEGLNPESCSITVSITSDNPGVAQVQPFVTFFPDGSSQAIEQIPIVATGPGTTVIHAGAPPYIPDSTLIVTVQGETISESVTPREVPTLR